jgi:uncharacterized membrane protein
MNLPDPLHPVVVHLPLALAMLAPFAAGLAFVVIRRGWLPSRVWIGVVLLQAVLVGSAWFAIETGEGQEERVERVVRESFIEQHEEAAERFLVAVGVVLVVSAGGLLRGSAGSWGRGATVAAGALALAAAVSVGHSGGELVYRHGAADAYVERLAGSGALPAVRPRLHDDD